MTPETIKDLGTTGAGALVAYGLLQSVQWDRIVHGEEVKVGVAILILILSYWAYRCRPSGGAAA